MAKMKYFPAYFTYRETLSGLSYEQIGKLFMALLEYADEGTIPEMEPMCKLAFSFIRGDIDRMNEKYDKKCAVLQENGSKGGRPPKQMVTEKPNGFSENQMVFEETKKTNSKGKGKSKGEGKSKEEELCAEPETSSASAPEVEEEIIASLILNDGTYFALTESMAVEYERLYPAVDVRQTFRNMEGWCRDNPVKRKTRQGVRRFIGNWLRGEQDKSHKEIKSAGYTPAQSEYGSMMDFLNEEIAKGGLSFNDQSGNSTDSQGTQNSVPEFLLTDAPI